MTEQNRTKLLIDLIAFFALLVSMDPHSTGIPIHEWLAVSLTGVIVIHLLLNWNWIVDLTRHLFVRSTNGSRFNYILNWLSFIDGVLIMLSGIMISESVMPAIGLTIQKSFTWRSLHDISANVFLLILGIHLARHWNWIICTTRRLFSGRKFESASRKGMLGKDAQS